jgi:hypothetical protein
MKATGENKSGGGRGRSGKPGDRAAGAKTKTPRSKKKNEGTRWGWIPILLLVIMGIGGTYLLLHSGEEELIDPLAGDASDGPGMPTLYPVLLYYGSPDDQTLVAEADWIEATASAEERITELMASLIRGSRMGNVSSIPPETTLLGAFLDGLGGAYLNFSGSLRTLHPRGDAMEWLTLRSIVGTVTQNIPEVERVWILIDGVQEDPLIEKVPLNRHYSWTDINS